MTSLKLTGSFVVVVATTTNVAGQPIPQQSPPHRLPHEPRAAPDPDGAGWRNRDERGWNAEWDTFTVVDQGHRLIIEWATVL